ncbi:MAG TPA: IclR family transcriptional regulator [Anaeromyxobacter sp.]|nr:IclR family transcriptional regulator [Anaeromyxobacter sp.]
MNVVQSLLKGLRALDLIRARPGPVRATEVAAQLEIDKASASRILHTLAQAGYLEQTPDRRFVPGRKLLPSQAPQLVEIVRLREHAGSLMARLVGRSQECAHLAVLAGDRALYLDAVESQHRLRVDHPPGTLAPLHCTALGKVFLAYACASIPRELERYTPRTITDPELLAAHLRSSAGQGYTIDDEEYSLGVRCVAAPLRDGAGRVIAAVGVSGAAARISLDTLADLGAFVRLEADGFGRVQMAGGGG